MTRLPFKTIANLNNEKNMKAFYTFIVFIFITLSSNISAEEILTPLSNKPEAPEFLLRDMDEKIKERDDYKGKPVIINFWATWCPPCREELPSMNRAWEKIKDEGIEMLAINIGEDEETISTFTKDFPIDFTILLDESSEEISNWSIRGLPTTFILDPQGHVIYRAVGGREWDNEKLLDMVRALKTEPKVVANKAVAKK